MDNKGNSALSNEQVFKNVATAIGVTFAIAVTVPIAAVTLLGSDAPPEPPSKVRIVEAPKKDMSMGACTDRGIAYFTEIGSYPYLRDGREAKTVAIERCFRTRTAF